MAGGERTSFPVTAIAPCPMFCHHTLHKCKLVRLNFHSVGCVQLSTPRCGRAVGVSAPPLAWTQRREARAGTCPCPPDRGRSVAATRTAAVAAPPPRQGEPEWGVADTSGEDSQDSRAAVRGRERDITRPHALGTRPPPAGTRSFLYLWQRGEVRGSAGPRRSGGRGERGTHLFLHDTTRTRGPLRAQSEQISKKKSFVFHQRRWRFRS